jgi:hypothetical protein
MVGKKELLGWVSDMCGRPVVSFSELKDGDALVRCVKETWPLAYDEVRPRFPKRMDGTRDPKENFELIKAIFAKIGLPPEALDTRGVRASAFKPCYNFLVVCFFLRNLALHSDFSVDFTHPVDQTLAQFLQSPASVASLRRGGALPPSPDKGAEKNLKAERRHDAAETDAERCKGGARRLCRKTGEKNPNLGAVHAGTRRGFPPPVVVPRITRLRKKLASRRCDAGALRRARREELRARTRRPANRLRLARAVHETQRRRSWRRRGDVSRRQRRFSRDRERRTYA